MTRDELRQAMPTVAAIVDEYREWLGRVVYATENGHVIDRRQPAPAQREAQRSPSKET